MHLIFKAMNSVGLNNIIGLHHHQVEKIKGGIRKFEFVAKTGKKRRTEKDIKIRTEKD